MSVVADRARIEELEAALGELLKARREVHKAKEELRLTEADATTWMAGPDDCDRAEEAVDEADAALEAAWENARKVMGE